MVVHPVSVVLEVNRPEVIFGGVELTIELETVGGKLAPGTFQTSIAMKPEASVAISHPLIVALNGTLKYACLSPRAISAPDPPSIVNVICVLLNGAVCKPFPFPENWMLDANKLPDKLVKPFVLKILVVVSAFAVTDVPVKAFVVIPIGSFNCPAIRTLPVTVAPLVDINEVAVNALTEIPCVFVSAPATNMLPITVAPFVEIRVVAVNALTVNPSGKEGDVADKVVVVNAFVVSPRLSVIVPVTVKFPLTVDPLVVSAVADKLVTVKALIVMPNGKLGLVADKTVAVRAFVVIPLTIVNGSAVDEAVDCIVLSGKTNPPTELLIVPAATIPAVVTNVEVHIPFVDSRELPSNVSPLVSVKRPPTVMNGTLPDVNELSTKVVEVMALAVNPLTNVCGSLLLPEDAVP